MPVPRASFHTWQAALDPVILRGAHRPELVVRGWWKRWLSGPTRHSAISQEPDCGLQAKTTKKISLRLECTECKYKHQVRLLPVWTKG